MGKIDDCEAKVMAQVGLTRTDFVFSDEPHANRGSAGLTAPDRTSRQRDASKAERTSVPVFFTGSISGMPYPERILTSLRPFLLPASNPMPPSGDRRSRLLDNGFHTTARGHCF